MTSVLIEFNETTNLSKHILRFHEEPRSQSTALFSTGMPLHVAKLINHTCCHGPITNLVTAKERLEERLDS